ncbi:hypothetical protein SERLADRAFT_404685 [Serpula lacrymans var. lacrymans S7.9]|uniref:Uncharacterized protein n=1 Tax=Serpula lacrymans var. lacrymans (strain S7.9) TaxID=578457 RepID=F8NED9_SERL9|nr:uncharacterized protein SERLADRAFT_404685 [Serpula lacrymans var. lacrymans S7.9]EGO30573.1 hypothetical protein SERLADRAFT_404685 [Serpula lacrymans var. lacrymans S7.9]
MDHTQGGTPDSHASICHSAELAQIEYALSLLWESDVEEEDIQAIQAHCSHCPRCPQYPCPSGGVAPATSSSAQQWEARDAPAPATRNSSSINSFIADLAAAHSVSPAFQTDEWLQNVKALMFKEGRTLDAIWTDLPPPKPSKKRFEQWHAIGCKFAAIASGDGWNDAMENREYIKVAFRWLRQLLPIKMEKYFICFHIDMIAGKCVCSQWTTSECPFSSMVKLFLALTMLRGIF